MGPRPCHPCPSEDVTTDRDTLPLRQYFTFPGLPQPPLCPPHGSHSLPGDFTRVRCCTRAKPHSLCLQFPAINRGFHRALPAQVLAQTVWNALNEQGLVGRACCPPGLANPTALFGIKHSDMQQNELLAWLRPFQLIS